MNTYSLSYIQLKDSQRLQYECGNSGRQTYGVSIFEQPSHLEMNTTFYPTPIGRNPFLSRIKLCCPIQSYKFKFLGFILCFFMYLNGRGYCVFLRKCVRLDLHTPGSETIFFQIYIDAPPGVPGVSKNWIFFTNKSVEFLPFWLTKHKE